MIDYSYWKPEPIVSIISIIYHWSFIGSEIRYINGQNHIWTILVLTVQGLLGESYLINTTIGPIWTYETVFCHRFSSNCSQKFQKRHLSQLSDFDEIVYTTEPSISSQKSLFLSPSFSKRWGPTGSSADRRHLQYYSNLLKSGWLKFFPYVISP